jgi:hypothetical protein
VCDIGLGTPRIVSRIQAATALTTAASPFALFTVSGDIIARLWATIQNAVTSVGGTGTLAVGVAGNTAAFLPQTTADGTNFVANAVWAGDNSPTVRAEAFSAAGFNWCPVSAGSSIIATIATNSMNAGQLTFHCQWLPVSQVANVLAA